MKNLRELITKIEAIVREAEIIRNKTVEEKGASFLRIPNKDILLWLATKQLENDIEIEKLKARFKTLTLVVLAIATAVISGHVI